MATTTNYSWTTPDDTDLVKDGAAAIRTLGSSVDTTTKNLNPQTTTGAIAYRSATSNVNTALPIGTAGQVLQVNSGATAPEWANISAGGLTLLSTTTLTGASVGITSISQDYVNLLVLVFGVTNDTANDDLRIKPNNSATLADQIITYGDSGGTEQAAGFRLNDEIFLNYAPENILRTNANNTWALTIFNYASTTAQKPFSVVGSYLNSNSETAAVTISGKIETASGISSLYFAQSGGNFSAGTVLIYGVK